MPAAQSLTLRTFVPPAKTRRELANLGLKEGIFYETGIPVSGKGEAADRQRYKQLLRAKRNESTRTVRLLASIDSQLSDRFCSHVIRIGSRDPPD